MKTIEDKRKQLQCRVDAAIAKRNRARQLEQDAEEELIAIRIEMTELDAVGSNG